MQEASVGLDRRDFSIPGAAFADNTLPMLRPGQALVLVVLALLMLGVVMVNSAGMEIRTGSSLAIKDIFSSRAALYALVAVGMMIAGACVPVDLLFRARGLRSPLPWVVIIMFILLAASFVPGLSRAKNGSSRWIELAGLSFQPSEFAKWAMILVLAWYAARRSGGMHKFTTGFLTPIWLVVMVCGLIALEDLGTAVLIGVVSVCLLVSAGARVWHAATVVPVALVGFIGLVVTSPYRVNRLLAYLDPYADSGGIGYHIIQSMAAVNGGGLAGRGLGNGVRKFGYLPEDTSDFIFAVVCEELGIVGATLVLFLYAALLIACVWLIRRIASVDRSNRPESILSATNFRDSEKSAVESTSANFPVACSTPAVLRTPIHNFYRLIVVGVMLTIGLQSAINIAVVTGVAPTKGIALPLLSHGGTGWALTAFSVGLLVAIDRVMSRSKSGATNADSAAPELELSTAS